MTRATHTLIPVTSITASINFYVGQLGLTLRFRDGDRYAALAGDDFTIALLGPEEHLAGENTALGIRVTDLGGFLDSGVPSPTTGPEQGPHELRVVLRDPDGHPVVVSQKNRQS